jgi:hypothetical protein
MSDRSNLKARHAAVANALANQRLEGLEPESKVVLDLQRFARGECDIKTVLKNFKARIPVAKYSDSGKDPYTYPDCDVLRNNLGLKDQAQLDTMESSFAAIRAAELAVDPIVGKFDLAHLQETTTAAPSVWGV